ncbi:hypothetical protein DFH27DRAFT_604522 [Peziza echinospora]|nr:hypothetical protein DFH27DRAFT_604522 [Peziza echinospora]
MHPPPLKRRRVSIPTGAKAPKPKKPPVTPKITKEDDNEYLYERVASEHRLKSAWEAIFAKYGADTSAYADELDLTTGRIVVDKGHIRGLEKKVDDGIGDLWEEWCDPEVEAGTAKKKKKAAKVVLVAGKVFGITECTLCMAQDELDFTPCTHGENAEKPQNVRRTPTSTPTARSQQSTASVSSFDVYDTSDLEDELSTPIHSTPTITSGGRNGISGLTPALNAIALNTSAPNKAPNRFQPRHSSPILNHTHKNRSSPVPSSPPIHLPASSPQRPSFPPPRSSPLRKRQPQRNVNVWAPLDDDPLAEKTWHSHHPDGSPPRPQRYFGFRPPIGSSPPPLLEYSATEEDEDELEEDEDAEEDFNDPLIHSDPTQIPLPPSPSPPPLRKKPAPRPPPSTIKKPPSKPPKTPGNPPKIPVQNNKTPGKNKPTHQSHHHQNEENIPPKIHSSPPPLPPTPPPQTKQRPPPTSMPPPKFKPVPKTQKPTADQTKTPRRSKPYSPKVIKISSSPPPPPLSTKPQTPLPRVHGPPIQRRRTPITTTTTTTTFGINLTTPKTSKKPKTNTPKPSLPPPSFILNTINIPPPPPPQTPRPAPARAAASASTKRKRHEDDYEEVDLLSYVKALPIPPPSSVYKPIPTLKLMRATPVKIEEWVVEGWGEGEGEWERVMDPPRASVKTETTVRKKLFPTTEGDGNNTDFLEMERTTLPPWTRNLPPSKVRGVPVSTSPLEVSIARKSGSALLGLGVASGSASGSGSGSGSSSVSSRCGDAGYTCGKVFCMRCVDIDGDTMDEVLSKIPATLSNEI